MNSTLVVNTMIVWGDFYPNGAHCTIQHEDGNLLVLPI
jgi:hypothetical protein